jgi:hypothetical protein
VEALKARGLISGESTHETKTTGHAVEHIFFVSDNAILSDIKAITKLRR